MKFSINGIITNQEDAHISPSDRGFRFGDGVFETIRIHSGKPYLWKEHLNRMFGGLQSLMIDTSPCDNLLEDALALIEANQIEHGILRVSVSRGVGSRGYLPMQPETHSIYLRPTVVMETHHLPNVSVGTHNKLCLSQYRRVPPECFPTEFKTMQGLPSVLAKMEAHAAGCVDGVQLSVKGHIAECSSSTLLWMRGKKLYVPSKATGCLAGVTAARLLRFAPYKIEIGLYKLKHLLKADAVILANSGMLITPIHTFIEGDKELARFKGSDALYDRCRIFFEQDMETNIGLDEEEE
jgi:branched-subunit amino acid aminotransferase/4-amino-4-deoxychorismate lyase